MRAAPTVLATLVPYRRNRGDNKSVGDWIWDAYYVMGFVDALLLMSESSHAKDKCVKVRGGRIRRFRGAADPPVVPGGP